MRWWAHVARGPLLYVVRAANCIQPCKISWDSPFNSIILRSCSWILRSSHGVLPPYIHYNLMTLPFYKPLTLAMFAVLEKPIWRCHPFSQLQPRETSFYQVCKFTMRITSTSMTISSGCPFDSRLTWPVLWSLRSHHDGIIPYMYPYFNYTVTLLANYNLVRQVEPEKPTFPARESLVSDIPAGHGKIANLFFTVYIQL